MCPPCCGTIHSSRRRHGVINETLRHTLDISQGSVTTHLRCGGIFSDSIITIFAPDSEVK